MSKVYEAALEERDKMMRMTIEELEAEEASSVVVTKDNIVELLRAAARALERNHSNPPLHECFVCKKVLAYMMYKNQYFCSECLVNYVETEQNNINSCSEDTHIEETPKRKQDGPEAKSTKG